jgi:hypothetical protein
MPKIIDSDNDYITFEPMRKPQSPVSDRHVNQRVAEDARNRYRKLRKLKERSRD